MKKRYLKSPVLLLTAAAVLLLASTVGSTQAALTYYSDNFSAQVNVANIDVTLMENGEAVQQDSNGDNVLFVNPYKEEGKTDEPNLATQELVLGKTYKEHLSVKNTGKIDAYVRVILTKSWQYDTDPSENVEKWEKDQRLSPELIELNLLTAENGYSTDWIEDETAATDERTVLYYSKILPAYQKEKSGAEITPDFTDTIGVSKEIAKYMNKEVSTDGKTVTYEYTYDDCKFVVEAEVDAVQTHNAKDAIKSAWGVDVTVAEDGTLSLN